MDLCVSSHSVAKPTPSECIARILTRGGLTMMTITPGKALSAKSFSRIVRLSGVFFTLTVLIATPALAR